MNRSIEELIFHLLTEEQIQEVLQEMEKIAREKLNGILDYYLSQKNKPDFPYDFDELINNAKWENFLPSEYYTLKKTQNEKENRKTG